MLANARPHAAPATLTRNITPTVRLTLPPHRPHADAVFRLGYSDNPKEADMNKTLITTLIAATALTGGCTTYGSGGVGYDDGGYGYYDRASYDRYGNYDYNRPDPSYNGYYADRYYRDDRRYRERRLSENDRIYRGENGQYYCRRSDGTTGLIVGAVAGGVLGNIIAPGRSDTLGTILGAIAGGAAGRAIDRNNVRCR